MKKPARKSARRAPSAESLETQLRMEIKHQITQLDGATYPALANRLHGVSGYRQVEEAVIGVCLKSGIPPGAALALLESEWAA